MVKDWRKLFVHRKNLLKQQKRTPKAPAVQSPLITSFHQWAGKRSQLWFSDESKAQEVWGQSWGLRKNLFAELLASPVRSDKATRIKLPRDLMIQMKLAPNKGQSTQKIAKLVPGIRQNVHAVKNSSYIGNSKRLIEGNRTSLAILAPSMVETSTTINVNLQDILFDREQFITEYRDILTEYVLSGIEKVQTHERADPSIIVEDWDVILTYDEKDKNDISILRLKALPCRPTVIILNLVILENDHLKKLINERLKNHDLGVVLKFLKDERLIRYVYSLLNFSK